MATLLEIYDLAYGGTGSPDTTQNSANLLKKVVAALMIDAHGILQETSGANLGARKSWAISVLRDPVETGRQVYRYLLSGNSGFTVAQLVGVSDAAVQSAVDSFVTQHIGAGA